MSGTGLVEIEGMRLEVARHAGDPARSTIVLLHEGLGSVAMWRDFPLRVAQATGAPVVAYSRPGYGRSSPARLPRGVGYMHEEARKVLPRLLAALAIERPILLGHSDGASIALLRAGDAPDAVAGVVAMAPHLFVEDRSIASIEAARDAWRTTDLPARLARYHDDADAAFRGWNDIWLPPGLPRLDHRGRGRARARADPRDPGPRRRVRHDGAARPYRGAASRRRAA